jgi:hypothetical protein
MAVQHGRSERLKMTKLARVHCPWEGSDESPTARVARAQGTYRTSHPLLADFFSILLDTPAHRKLWKGGLHVDY